MLPCPKCGRAVVGKTYGGNAAFGCGEYDFEVECECGIMFNVGSFETETEALENGERLWNDRVDADAERKAMVELIVDLDNCRNHDDCGNCSHYDDHGGCDLNLAQRVFDVWHKWGE